MSEPELYIGLMSGTSADGLDAALVGFDGDRPQLVAHLALSFSDEMQQSMALLRTPGEGEMDLFGRLDGDLGGLCADAVRQLLQQAGSEAAGKVAAVGWAGHTVRHAPDARPPYCLTAGNPAIICQRTGLPVACEFRRSDMAAGGQGAPLAPLFHQAFFSGDKARVVINLGGIANVSLLPERGRSDVPLRGFDTGPASCLMDEWAQRHLGQAMDEDGRWARLGKVSVELLQRMLAEPWLSRPSPKSTGRELFNLGWLDGLLQGLPQQPEPVDVQATLALFTARSLVQHLAGQEEADKLILCGGSAANGFLTELIAAEMAGAGLDAELCTSEMLGLPVSQVEAAGIAWLARCRLQRQPLDMTAVTGGGRVLLGALLLPS